VTARAEEILFKQPGWQVFERVRFQMEPIGAAYLYTRWRPNERGRCLRFRGGTLDLTVADLGGAQEPEILSAVGVLVGGDDLDRCMIVPPDALLWG